VNIVSWCAVRRSEKWKVVKVASLERGGEGTSAKRRIELVWPTPLHKKRMVEPKKRQKTDRFLF